VAILALSMTGVPLFAQARLGTAPAQRGGAPNPDTPQILVATFQSSSQQLGVEMGDELRSRIQDEHSAKDLYAVTKTNINNALIASGYRPDSALNASDLMELARITHGDYVIDGKIEKAGNGVHVTTRLLNKTGQQTLTQPLPTIDGKDAGDAAKMIERNISEALKQMVPYKACIADLRAQKYDVAVKDASLAITAYPNTSFGRICLLQAVSNLNLPDSVIGVANAILSRDSTSMLALVNLADAYSKKGDKDKAIETNLRIYRVDPTNTTVATSIVNDLASSGAPDKALPIIDSLLAQNPGDPAMLSTKWKLQLASKRYKQALVTADLLAKADTAAANLDFYNRNIGAAQADSNPTKVLELAAKAGQKYPKEISLQLLMAQGYAKAGQSQQALVAARKAMEIDPKSTDAVLLAMYAQNAMNQPDSAFATAQKAIAAGANRDQIAQTLLATAAPAVQHAQQTKARADWEAALKAAQAVDGVAPSPQSKFYIGVSSFQIGVSIMDDVQSLAKTAATKKDDKVAACTQAKAAEDVFATTAIAMPAGGSVDKTVAGQILGALAQYGEYIGQVKKAYCK
jgi:tetratricopeptide (TPR) repeat protein